MAGELQALKLRQVVAELRKLDRLLNEQQLQRHVSFMRTVIKNFDARDMLKLSTELQTQVRSFEVHLSGLTGSGRSLAAGIGNRPPQEISPGRFTPSQGGDIAEFRALSSKLSQRLNSLAKEVSSLRIEANTKLNEPGRYGDAAMPNPVNDLLAFLQSVLDLVRRINGL